MTVSGIAPRRLRENSSRRVLSAPRGRRARTRGGISKRSVQVATDFAATRAPQPDRHPAARRNGKLDGKHEVKMQITPSNCVQCGAITAKGGRLTPPEGGDGPNYQAT